MEYGESYFYLPVTLSMGIEPVRRTLSYEKRPLQHGIYNGFLALLRFAPHQFHPLTLTLTDYTQNLSQIYHPQKM